MKAKQRISKRVIIIVSIISGILLLTLSLSLAWFTKNTVDDNFDLNFANVDISLNSESDSAVEFLINDKNISSDTLLMPGDVVSSKIKVTNTGEVACYYLVSLKCKEINMETDFYYSSKTEISNSTNKALGILNVNEYHILNISSLIDKSFSEQGKTVNFSCSVFAIQTKNITSDKAYSELIKLKGVEGV